MRDGATQVPAPMPDGAARVRAPHAGRGNTRSCSPCRTARRAFELPMRDGAARVRAPMRDGS
jgi:hypothetical protein